VSRVVLDTSIIIDGKVTELVNSGELGPGSEIIVPIAALDELQSQASRHREEGFVGLEELTKLKALCDEKNITFTYTGQRPSIEDIRLASGGRIDAIIRDVAKEHDAVLLTADYVQALVGRAQGVKVQHFRAETKTAGLEFERYFDEHTLSVHLKEGVKPYAKKGLPGNFTYVSVGEKEITREDLERMIKEVAEAARVSSSGSLEISRSGASVFQLGLHRIAVARPPFSDALEVTIVKPLVRLSIKDYNISSKLENRLATKAEGIIIAGPPGSGKSTLASALADFYLEKARVVKTLESPKDLQVSDAITQYGALEGDFEKTAEILLLVRPDYTIFDEVRRTRDFEVFADMRLAGVGMVGVVHASDPVNAVQRFMSRMELGMVPHIVDTVIFVKAGRIEKVLELNLVVKVPSGMTEPDLARPVVEVREFESGKLAYEIYTYGEENVVIPIGESDSEENRVTGMEKLAQERILQVVKKFDPLAEVRILSPSKIELRVDESNIPRIIGKGGSNIKEIENMLSLHIDVKPKDSETARTGSEELDYDLRQKGSSIDLLLGHDDVGKKVKVYSDEGLLLEATIGNKSVISFPKKSENGRKLMAALRMGRVRVLSS
jgi:ATPase